MFLNKLELGKRRIFKVIRITLLFIEGEIEDREWRYYIYVRELVWGRVGIRISIFNYLVLLFFFRICG